MTTDGHNVLNFEHHDKAHEKALAELHRLPDDLANRVEAIERNPELHPEARAHRIDKARREAEANRERLEAAVRHHDQEVEDLWTRFLSGVRVHPSAEARLRQLLDRGLAHNQILDRARGLEDEPLIVALLKEALYHGDRKGFVEAGETVGGCVRALGDLDTSNDGDMYRLSLKFAERRKSQDELFRFARKGVEGRHQGAPRTRLALALGRRAGRVPTRSTMSPRFRGVTSTDHASQPEAKTTGRGRLRTNEPAHGEATRKSGSPGKETGREAKRRGTPARRHAPR